MQARAFTHIVIPLKMSGLRCGRYASRVWAMIGMSHPAQNERAPLRPKWLANLSSSQDVIPLKMSGLRCGDSFCTTPRAERPSHPAQNERAPLRRDEPRRGMPVPGSHPAQNERAPLRPVRIVCGRDGLAVVIPLKMSGLRCGLRARQAAVPAYRVIPLKMSGLRCGRIGQRARQSVAFLVIPLKMSGLRCGMW